MARALPGAAPSARRTAPTGGRATRGAGATPSGRRWRLHPALAAGLSVAAVLLAIPRLALGYLHILQHTGMGSRTDFAWMYYAMRVVWLRLQGRLGSSALYRLASQRAWMRGQRIPFSGLDLYSYPPQFAVAFAPLAALGYRAARTVWTLLSLGWFLGGVGFACALADVRRDWRVWALLAGVGLACFPALTTFFWGQTDTLILFVTAAALWFIYRSRWPAVGGALLALGTLFKLTPAIILAYYAARWALGRACDRLRVGGRRPEDRSRLARDRAVVVSGIATACAVTALSAAVLGWGPFVAYLTQVLPQVQKVALAVGPAPMEQSLRGVLLLFVRPGPGPRVAVDLLSVGAVAGLLAVDLRHPRGDPRGEAAGVALLSLVCAPSLEGHHFVVTALPEVVVGGWLLQRRDAPRWAVAVAWAAYAAAVLLLTVPGYPFLPRIGRPLCALSGHPAWITGGHVVAVACDGQHLWSVLLLYALALYAVAVRRPRRGRGVPVPGWPVRPTKPRRVSRVPFARQGPAVVRRVRPSPRLPPGPAPSRL